MRHITKDNVDDMENPLDKMDPEDPKDYTYQAPLDPQKNFKKKAVRALSAICVAFTLLFIFRDSVTYYVPQLVGIYKFLNIEVTPSAGEKFEIREKAWSNIVENGVPSIIVQGDLANMSDRVLEAPSLRITLKGKGACKPSTLTSKIFKDKNTADDKGVCVMDEWYVRPTNDRLLPGQIVPFSTAHPYDERFMITNVYIDFVR